jgi:hypothetical protein
MYEFHTQRFLFWTNAIKKLALKIVASFSSLIFQERKSITNAICKGNGAYF